MASRPNLSDETRFEMRRGAKTGIKLFALPVFLIMGIVLLVGAIMAAVQYQRIPHISNPMDQSQTSASTDLYADSFFSALQCMANKESGGCNIGDKQSTMLQQATQNTLNLNGKTYSMADKASVLKTVQTTPLKSVDYNNLTTTQRGQTVNTITYQNSKTSITLNFSKNINNELILTSMTMKDIR